MLAIETGPVKQQGPYVNLRAGTGEREMVIMLACAPRLTVSSLRYRGGGVLVYVFTRRFAITADRQT
jgi:hypothetical protein